MDPEGITEQRTVMTCHQSGQPEKVNLEAKIGEIYLCAISTEYMPKRNLESKVGHCKAANETLICSDQIEKQTTRKGEAAVLQPGRSRNPGHHLYVQGGALYVTGGSRNPVTPSSSRPVTIFHQVILVRATPLGISLDRSSIHPWYLG